jgi:hypothetical protein
MRRLVLILVDGLRPDVAESMLDAGELPHLAAMVAQGGLTRGVTVFPSTTTVAYLPLLTGCTPGTTNVPSIRWLDRASYSGHPWRDRRAIRSYCGYQGGLVDRDIAPAVRTMFELCPGSAGLFTSITRGLTPGRDPLRAARKWLGTLGHFMAPFQQVTDDLVGRRLLQEVDSPRRFIFAVFPAVDGLSHLTAPDAPAVRRALTRIDTVVGRVRERLARRGELDESLILLVSDHGAAPVHTHFDLADWFSEQGVPALAHPLLWTSKPRAAVMVAGNGSAMVYARPGTPRGERWPMSRLRHPDAFGTEKDLVAALARQPAIGLLAAEDGRGGLTIVSADGEGAIHREGSRITYRPASGDPLALGGGRNATADEWLRAAGDDLYPDAGPQLLDLFRSPRTGDLVVAANEGFDLRDDFEVPEHRAGHGSLVRSQMQIPIWSSHRLPVDNEGELVPMRSADLFPAMATWLGIDIPAGIDGRLVWRPQAPSKATARRPVRRVAARAAS